MSVNRPPNIAAAAPTMAASPAIKSEEVFVSASKEWVLPARPKPGRKPITTPPPTKRKAQNRAAQRAFRERKASYITELEDKVRQFEQQDMNKNVQLQQTSRRLLEENQSLKLRNSQLEEEIRRLKEPQKLKRKKTEAKTELQSQPQTPAQTPNNPYLELTRHDTTPMPASPALSVLNEGCGFCTSDTICVCNSVSIPGPQKQQKQPQQSQNSHTHQHAQPQQQPSQVQRQQQRPIASMNNFQQQQLQPAPNKLISSFQTPPPVNQKSMPTPLCHSCVSTPAIAQLYRFRGGFYSPTYPCAHCQAVRRASIASSSASHVPAMASDGSVVFLPGDSNWDIATEERPTTEYLKNTESQSPDAAHNHELKMTAGGALLLDTGDDILRL